MMARVLVVHSLLLIVTGKCIPNPLVPNCVASYPGMGRSLGVRLLIVCITANDFIVCPKLYQLQLKKIQRCDYATPCCLSVKLLLIPEQREVLTLQ